MGELEDDAARARAERAGPTTGNAVRAALESQLGLPRRPQVGDDAANAHNALTSMLVFYGNALQGALARAETAEREVARLKLVLEGARVPK